MSKKNSKIAALNAYTTTSIKVATPEPVAIPAAHIGEHEGKRHLILNPGGRFAFQFRLNKAKLIVENIDMIKAFVAEEEAKEAKPTTTTDIAAALSKMSAEERAMVLAMLAKAA